MIARIDIEGRRPGLFEYSVSYEAEELYADAGLGSVVECLVAAIEGMPPEVAAAQIWYRGIVSGTYPLEVVGLNVEQVAQHAVNTTAAIDEVLGEDRAE
ncbi:hypothetical protein [Caldimonas brevitalea]|uniref:Uncharacterized protein n=1 Tax=Caldimonas brevitalea TaxID=413882 RepID=A0A0G3BDH6_9BURK|nr:hypothetical protein [Caldimonas brevitalea]AKJ27444.1 hypothetical protein AAW51_0753 [Caldimonas brevitalea]